jgi:hypothetical protein
MGLLGRARSRTAVIHLADERHARLVIEVDDPWATASRINQALAVDPSPSTGSPG